MIRIYILKELEKTSASGYTLREELAKYNAGKKPSPGTLYPLLKDLLETKNISVKTIKNKKIYTVTAKGKKTLQSLGVHHAKVMQETANILRLCATTSKKKQDISKVVKILKNADENNPWIAYTSQSMHELKGSLLALINKPFDEKKAKKLQRDIQSMTKSIIRLSQ